MPHLETKKKSYVLASTLPLERFTYMDKLLALTLCPFLCKMSMIPLTVVALRVEWDNGDKNNDKIETLCKK